MSSNYKPDESTLISWIYGDLDELEHARVEKYFLENPEERKRVEDIVFTRQALGSLEDKEVLTPPVLTEIPDRGRSLWQSVYFKTVMSIAASFLLLMIAGKLIGLEINYRQGELRISFGASGHEAPYQLPGSNPGLQKSDLSPEDVQGMINASLTRNNESMAATWADQQKKVDQSIRQNLALNSKKIDDVMKHASESSQDQVRTFVAGLQSENLRLMKDYLQLSSTEQRKYTETLLVDFSKYLREQRNQDLNVFETRMTNMEKNSDQFKQDTEQILSSIISTASITKKKNSY